MPSRTTCTYFHPPPLRIRPPNPEIDPATTGPRPLGCEKYAVAKNLVAAPGRVHPETGLTVAPGGTQRASPEMELLAITPC